MVRVPEAPPGIASASVPLMVTGVRLPKLPPSTECEIYVLLLMVKVPVPVLTLAETPSPKPLTTDSVPPTVSLWSFMSIEPVDCTLMVPMSRT